MVPPATLSDVSHIWPYDIQKSHIWRQEWKWWQIIHADFMISAACSGKAMKTILAHLWNVTVDWRLQSLWSWWQLCGTSSSHDADDNFVPIAAVMLRQVVKQKTWNLNVCVCVCMSPVPILAAVTKHVCDEWRVLMLMVLIILLLAKLSLWW